MYSRNSSSESCENFNSDLHSNCSRSAAAVRRGGSYSRGNGGDCSRRLRQSRSARASPDTRCEIGTADCPPARFAGGFARAIRNPSGNGPRVGIEIEFDDRHRRHRGQIVRIEHAEQGFGQLGKFVVELVMNPAGQAARTIRSSARRADRRCELGSSSSRPAAAGYLRRELLGKLPDEQSVPVRNRETAFRSWFLCRLLACRKVQ